MRYAKRVSRVSVVGRGWYGQTMATSYDLDDSALRNIRATQEDHVYTRDGVEEWLMLNSGDFKFVDDFAVTISDADGNDFDSPWTTEDGELAYQDCMDPEQEACDAD